MTKPATALPYRYRAANSGSWNGWDGVLLSKENYDSLYEIACAYPQLLEDRGKLVDLAKAIVTAFGDIRFRSRTEDHLYEGARALLRELGETE